MAKFLSYDGVDKQGVRAEVMVQTGTGRIKEIVGRGSPKADGSYRNMEVVFDPDNPKLQRKVYALLDTTASELWAYVQDAHATQKDISYRIESQRRRTVDRNLKFEDLVHAEQVVRVLASIDDVYSHEAKTSPNEDPESDAPSALAQEISGATAAIAGETAQTTGSLVSASALLDSLAEARKLNLASTIIDTLVANAVSAGASLSDALSAGIGNDDDARERKISVARGYAVEEKPWTAYNSDGRVNPGSYAVAHAATAERFSLDHLVMLYSEGKKSKVSVSDEMIAQASSLAIEILECADTVQRHIVGRIDRQKNSYNRALSLILESIEKRHYAPIGGNSEAVSEWKETIETEAKERFIGVLYVTEGIKPTVEHLTGWVPGQSVAASVPASKSSASNATEEADSFSAPAPTEPSVAEQVSSDTEAAASKPAQVSSESLLATSLGATEVSENPAGIYPAYGEPGYQEPSKEVIEALRDICVNAEVVDNPKAISDWLEGHLGVRSARKAHHEAVQNLVKTFQAIEPAVLKQSILSGNIASVA